jgi:hypothetical protein
VRHTACRTSTIHAVSSGSRDGWSNA